MIDKLIPDRLNRPERFYIIFEICIDIVIRFDYQMFEACCDVLTYNNTSFAKKIAFDDNSYHRKMVIFDLKLQV